FTIGVQGQSAGFELSRALEITGLDLEYIVAAVSVLIDPFADGVTVETWRFILRPTASVGEDSAWYLVYVEDDVGGRRRDDKFHREYDGHDPRHAQRNARNPGVSSLTAGVLICQALLENGLVLRRERRILCAAARLGRIPWVAHRARRVGSLFPLARPIRIF